MELTFQRCAGLAVHRESVMVTARLVDAQERLRIEQRRSGTLPAEMEALAAWLAGLGVTHVAMEATGVYWKPIYDVLAAQLEVWIVDTRRLRHVPARQSGMSDADWIALLMQYGLLQRIPGAELDQ